MNRPKLTTNVASLYFCPNGQCHLVFPPMIENMNIYKLVTWQQVIILAAKPDDQSSILGAHMVEGDN